MGKNWKSESENNSYTAAGRHAHRAKIKDLFLHLVTNKYIILLETNKEDTGLW